MAAGEDLSRVVAALERARGPDRQGWYTALCPFHNDREHPNLRFTEQGFNCMACGAKGSLGNLVQRLGLGDDHRENDSRITATYDYRDEEGALLFQVVRKAPKAFPQRRPDGAGGWIWNLDGVRRVLYRLPELLAADSTVLAFVGEGEKDINRLVALGLVATTNPGGAGKWRDEYSEALRGRRIVILPDNDDAGREHAEQVARSAHSAEADVRILELPGLPQKGDVSDWLDAGGTPEELLILAASAPLWESESTGARLLDFATTDAGNGELFAQQYGDRVRYDHRRKRWLIWSGHWWREDLDGEVRRLAKAATRHRFLDTTGIEDLNQRAAAAKFAIATENRQRLDAMLLQAQTEPPIADAGDAWDDDPWLLGAANGVVDLRTGELRAGLAEDRITMRTDVAFDPEAACPRWLRFLDEVFRGDAALIDYLWRAAGYSLTGDVREQCLFLCHGRGSNGKSVFLATLRALAGHYAYNTPFSTFELDRRASIPNDVAAIAGRRLVTSSETNEGTRLNEARLKALTGGDTMTARFLHSEFFAFEPVAKFWLAVNHRPVVNDDSHGFWRRVRLIPFTRVFSGDEDDQQLRDRLHAELPGILVWAVRGALEWQARGLAPPDAVQVATESYRAESDPLAQFLDERCVVERGCQVSAAAAYKAYCEWASAQGIGERERLSNKAFGTRMTSRFEKTKGKKGRTYVGIGLLGELESAARLGDGSVTGCESDGQENDVDPLASSLSRENITEPFTMRHPSPPNVVEKGSLA